MFRKGRVSFVGYSGLIEVMLTIFSQIDNVKNVRNRHS